MDDPRADKESFRQSRECFVEVLG